MGVTQCNGFYWRLGQTVEATMAAYEAIVRSHMPDGRYHDFCLWGISKQNPIRSDMLQISGAIQICKLSVYLFEGLIDGDASYEQAAISNAPMHAWQLLEVMSDNLAIGLAGRRAESEAQTTLRRRELLKVFNELTVRRLKGEISADSARDSLSKISSVGVSLLDQHLAAQKLRSIAEIFIQEVGGALHELEYAARPLLIANLEAAFELAGAVKIKALGELVRGSLANRYKHINVLLEPLDYPIDELLEGGAYTILGIPVLGYYIATLIQCLGLKPRVDSLRGDSGLARALYHASVISRLQNDLGSELLGFDETKLRRFCAELVERSREYQQETLFELFARIGKDYSVLNRIWKDASLGEFNICLRRDGKSIASRESVRAFGHRISVCIQAFEAHKTKLDAELNNLSSDFKDGRISEIILRFLRFHEELYGGRYHDTIEGDYATL